jgi:hypothetical protein
VVGLLLLAAVSSIVLTATAVAASAAMPTRAVVVGARRSSLIERKKHKKPKPAKATTTTRVSAAATKAQVTAYCASAYCASATGPDADTKLFDDAMTPLLQRRVRDIAAETNDPSLAADATTVLNTLTASLSASSLAQVPAAIRSDVQAVRTEKQAVMQNLVNAANGDRNAYQFLLQATDTGGGVLTQIMDITAYLQANCTTSSPGATTSTTG